MEYSVDIYCNSDILWIRGFKKCALSYTHTKEKDFIMELNCDVKQLSNVVRNYLLNIEEIEYSKEMIDKLMSEAQEDTNEQFKYLQLKYKYKDKNDMYKNMMLCFVSLVDKNLTISPFKHNKSASWKELGKEHDIITRFPIPDELLGAAIRFAFTRCVGSGAIKVAKLLFPTGIPNSLDEYLASVNPNYKDWLISAGK